MSVVTNIVVLLPRLDDAEHTALLRAACAILIRDGQHSGFADLSDEAGGPKHLEGHCWLGAFNHLDLVAFLRKFNDLPWPCDVLLGVREQGDERWHEIMVWAKDYE